MGDMPIDMVIPGPFMMLVFAAMIIIPFWIIFTKAGHSKWLSLLMAVPIVNVLMLYFLAFSSWPVHKGTGRT
jgi:hypothetical protein